jgi:hypothetical protein
MLNLTVREVIARLQNVNAALPVLLITSQNMFRVICRTQELPECVTEVLCVISRRWILTRGSSPVKVALYVEEECSFQQTKWVSARESIAFPLYTEQKDASPCSEEPNTRPKMTTISYCKYSAKVVFRVWVIPESVKTGIDLEGRIRMMANTSQKLKS